jgi:putative membrane protein
MATTPNEPADRVEASASSQPGEPRRDPLRQSTVSSAWIGVVIVTLVLVLLVIFILQNRQSVKVSYFGFSGSIPLAAAMLISAVAALVIAAVAGTMRIWQIRRRVRHDKTRR